MPQHNHFITASGDKATQVTALGASLASIGRGTMPNIYVSGIGTPVVMVSSTSISGGG